MTAVDALRELCKAEGVRLSVIQGIGKAAKLSETRRRFCVALRSDGYSLEEIGAALRRHRSTITHHLKVAKVFDDINRPPHYAGGAIEAIDVIESFGLVDDYLLGNVAKYILRAGLKVGANESKEIAALRDLKKAAWYLRRKIQRLEQLTGDKES